jgi:hypothetical protein
MESPERKAAPSFVKEFKSLVAKNIRGNMQLVSRVNELVKKAGKSLEPDRQKSEGKQSALVMRFLDFNLASYEIMSSCTLDMLNRLISAAELSLLGKGAATAEAAPPKVCGEIQVAIRQGERLKAPFVVENQHSAPLDISFEAGELTAAAAPSLPSSHIAFEPATLTLGPQKKAVVVALVDISKAFVVGKTYRSTIRVLGFQGQEVRLVLTILPPAKMDELTRKAKPKRQTQAPRTRRSKRPPSSPAGRERAARK